MELIITIVLLGILGAVGSTMISDSFKTTRLVDASEASKAQARYAMERLAREIREVKYDGVSSYCITTMTTSPPKLVFYKTNGTYATTCNTNADTVTIDTSGANLRLGYTVAGVTTTSNLSDQLGSFALDYLNTAGVTGATAANVRFVVIQLTVTDPVSGVSISQRTRVALRNS